MALECKLSGSLSYCCGTSHCGEQESILERSHSHMFVSFHNARLIRGDLPNKPIESHAGYTQKGNLSNRSERSELWHKEERWTLVSSQVSTVAAYVQWNGSLAGL